MSGLSVALRVMVLLAGLGARPEPGMTHEIYVSNEKDNTVSVIDSKSLEVVRTFKVGKRPRGITFSRDHKHFYLCASDNDAVQVYSTDGDAFLYDLPSGRDPEQFAVSRDGRRLYIANEDDAVTTIVDTEKKAVVKQVDVGVEPEGMAVSPDDKLFVTTSETTNMAHIINAETMETVANVLVDPRPRHAEFTPDGKKLWVSSEIGGTITIIDVATFKEEKKISFSLPGIPTDNIQPVGFKMTNDGKRAYVALGPAARVAVIDIDKAEVIKYIVTGQRVWHVDLTPEEDLLFTTNGVTNDVTVIDTASLKPVKSIKVGRYPWGLAVRPTP